MKECALQSTYHDILKHEVRINDEGVRVLGENGRDELRKLRARLLPELALLGILARYPLEDDGHKLSHGGSYFNIDSFLRILFLEVFCK